ncbi:MAG: hypothetical protein NWQ07_04080, partial [Flaviramulus sp.]|nr:hypothetical protein [Flaviramulus sp.]
TMSAQCIDIDTKSIVNYLNKEIKPSLDMKLDKTDGFLAIKGKRQNFSVPKVTVSPLARDWDYNFENVRRMDSNFFYDSKKNAVVLDIKFENDGPEIKGTCPGCIKASRDSRAPDIDWESPNILRIFLKPIIYQNSVSFEVSDMTMLGKFNAKGLGDIFLSLTKDIEKAVKLEMIALFGNGETQRLFNDAIKPLLNENKVSKPTSVTMASSSLRICK